MASFPPTLKKGPVLTAHTLRSDFPGRERAPGRVRKWGVPHYLLRCVPALLWLITPLCFFGPPSSLTPLSPHDLLWYSPHENTDTT